MTTYEVRVNGRIWHINAYSPKDAAKRGLSLPEAKPEYSSEGLSFVILVKEVKL